MYKSLNTDQHDRKFYYRCQRCQKPLSSCPDPACQEEGVIHHQNEEDWDGCADDIPYSEVERVYDLVLQDLSPSYIIIPSNIYDLLIFDRDNKNVGYVANGNQVVFWEHHNEPGSTDFGAAGH